MTRRQALALLVAAAIGQASGALAQARRVARIGYLGAGRPGSNEANRYLPGAFAERGWIVGKNLAVESRFATGRLDRLQRLATELVDSGVEVIVAQGNLEAQAARSAMSPIPIVTQFALDPVGAGLAKNLSRPGGKVTGALWADPAQAAEIVGLLRQAVPSLQRLAALYSAIPGVDAYVAAAESAARLAGMELVVARARGSEELAAALEKVRRLRIHAAVLAVGPELLDHGVQRILRFAATHGMVTAFHARLPVELGGFLGLVPDYRDNARSVAVLVDKLLEGLDSADLAFERAAPFELIVNARAARGLGMDPPQLLLRRAAEVIR